MNEYDLVMELILLLSTAIISEVHVRLFLLLQTLLLLAESPESVRSYMRNFIGMTQQLQAIRNK